ncbi:PAS domain S-box protein, partial [Leptolyngbyaceae cyanobacterium UHCC 1019]
ITIFAARAAAELQRQRVESALQRSYDEMEQRVQERTRQLRESEQQLRAIFNAEPECVKIITAEGVLENMNPAGLAMIEADNLAQVQGQNICPLIEPAHQQAFLEFTQQVAEGKPGTLEFEIIGLQGTRCWLESHAVPLDAPGELTTQVLAITRDITDRKRAEAEIRQLTVELEQRVADRTADLQVSQARFAGILEIANDAIISVDSSQRITLFNQGAEKIFGYTATEILGQSLEWLLPQRFTALHYQHIGNFAQANSNARQMGERSEIFGRRQDGTEFPAEASISRLEIGEEMIFTAILRDVSDRKRTEAALQASETKFRSLCECSPIGIFMMDAEAQLTYMNSRAQEIAGHALEESLGNEWMGFIHPDDLESFLNQMQTSTQEPKGGVFEDLRHFHKDGSMRYVRVQYTPTFGANSEFLGYVGTAEDVTEWRAIDRMKTEFISIVSHELRTPLTAIRGSLGLLAAGVYDQKPEKGKRMVQVAAQQSDRLVRLVNDILDLQRLESGRIKLTMQACDATVLMQQSVDTMRPGAEQNQIQLLVTSLPIQVWAAPDSIIQTLTNLLSNAIKFSNPGSKIWLSVEMKNEGNSQFPILNSHALFTLQDEGRGIPTEKLEVIFERFQQVDASDSREKGGTGLGLAICRKIIEQHEGRIWAESVLGKGSTFYFTLPLANED